MTLTGPIGSEPIACCSGGGGIQQDADANTTVSDSTVNGNSVSVDGMACCHGGGGIYVDSASPSFSTTLTNSAVNGNTVTVNGPSITNSDDQHCCSGGGGITTLDSVSITGGTMNGNTVNVTAGDCCQGGGGARIDADQRTASITRADLSGNKLTVDGSGCCSGGGGIGTWINLAKANPAVTSRLVLVASLISGNRADISGGTTQSGGGGIFASNDGANGLTNSTISDNTTNASGAQQGGGGLYLRSPGTQKTETLANATVAGNSASSGSGAAILSEGYAVRFRNSIVAGNSAALGGGFACFLTGTGGSFTSLGHNLGDFSTSECGFSKEDTRVSVPEVGLGPLADNGGPTRTRALKPGSPAIDGGLFGGCKDPLGVTLNTDQRGLRRPLDGNGDLVKICDIGAFEAPAKVPACTLTPRSSKVAQRRALTAAKKKKKKKHTLKLTAKCDERVAVKLAGTIKVKTKKTKKHGSKTKSFAVAANGSADPNVPLVFRVTVPKSAVSALKKGARGSASFHLTGENVNGTSRRATAKIAKLKLKHR